MTPSSPRRTLDELAASAPDDHDLRVMARLAALYDRLDPVPSGLVERIQFGITLDALHAEIAELQRSSPLAGVRSGDASQTQTVTFTSANLTTMITVSATSADHVRIDGWAVPGAGLTVELRTVGGVLTTVTDSDGRFVLDEVPNGFAQFTLRPAPGTASPTVVTPSIEL